MIALGVGIGNTGAANALYLVQYQWVAKDRRAQIYPVPPLAARDDIVDGRARETLMVEMSVQHWCQFGAAILAGEDMLPS